MDEHGVARTEQAGWRLAVLQRFAGICTESVAERELLEDVTTALVWALDAAGAATWLTVPVAPGLFGAAARQGLSSLAAPDLLELRELGAAGPRLLAGEIVLARSPGEISTTFASLALAMLERGLEAAVAVPFRHAGECAGLGLAGFERPWPGDALAVADLHLAGALTGQALAGIAARERLRRLATHDTLTGLPNRHRLTERLDEALLRAGRTLAPVSVVFVDLVDFDATVARLGPAGREAVLVETAQRIVHAVRDVDFVAHLGAEEFVVVCEDSEPDAATTVAGRIQSAMARPMRVLGQRLKVGVRLETAVHHTGTGSVDAPWLLGEADRAEYAAGDRFAAH